MAAGSGALCVRDAHPALADSVGSFAAYWLVVETDGTTAYPSAFLSHASEDKTDFAEPLGRALADLGVKPWLDKWEIRPGDSLVQKLFDEGLGTVDAVVVVISASSAGKPWVREELDAAMVARITRTTKLIPVRLDHADVPAPLRHLVWINGDRSVQGAQDAAGQIADTLHGRDLRPAVADPPVYVATMAIPGLTAADTTLMVTLAEDAIASGSLLAISWRRVCAMAEAKGISGELLLDSLTVLRQHGYVEIQYVAGTPHRIELSSAGFDRCADMIVPDAEQARQTINLTLVNEPPTGIRVVDDLAEATNTPPLFVLEYLKHLEGQGYLGLSLTLGGFSRVYGISPALRRLVPES